MKRRQLLQTSGLFTTSLLATTLIPASRAKASIVHQIHIANNSSEAIYVLPVPNSDWVWADIGFDVATTVAISLATAGTGTAAASANTVRSLSTLEKVIKVAKMIATVTYLPRTVATWVTRATQAANLTEAALLDAANKDLLAVRDFLGRDAILVGRDEFKQVFKEGVWSPTRYISPSGIGAAFGSSNMTLFIINESLSRLVKFNTNGDYSWIINMDDNSEDNDYEAVRAQYGRIWRPDRGEGFYRISVGDSLYNPQFLLPGQSLSSPNGDYNLIYQKDGNAVIYKRDKPDGERAIWTSNTSGRSAGKLVMQGDGNVVIYDAEGAIAWAHNRYTDSGDEYPCQLVMQDDGRLVSYIANVPNWSSR